MKSLFLSGGTGFLGGHIQDYFFRQYKILAPRRQELNLLDANSVDHYFCHTSNIDCILNLASVGVGRNSTKLKQDCLFENMLIFRD